MVDKAESEKASLVEKLSDADEKSTRLQGKILQVLETHRHDAQLVETLRGEYKDRDVACML